MKFVALLLILPALVIPAAAWGQDTSALDFSGAEWLWHPDASAENVCFRQVVDVDRTVERMTILIAADDSYELRINQRLIGSAADWMEPQRYDILRPLARDNSTIAVNACNYQGNAGMICKVVVALRDGTERVFVSDGSWRCLDGSPDGWDARDEPKGDWVAAKSLGRYPCGPWGDTVREPWEVVRARLAERRSIMSQASESAVIPSHSAFSGEYLRPEYAELYDSFVKLNPRTGLLEHNGKVIRPFFTVYSQPAPDGGRILNIPEMDFDLLEKDFARMKQSGINVQARFWNWSELLNYDGTWKRVDEQPSGHGLPYFTYVFQVYDHFLDRAQAHGLYVNIQPSLSGGLHPEVVPPSYRGRILLYDELWHATKEAYAKILDYYSTRTVIVATMVGDDDLVFDHALDDPAMLVRFRRSLQTKYGSISNLRRAWARGYDYTDRSMWTERAIDGREVLWPEYPLKAGAFDSCRSFDDVWLPVLDYCRSADVPNAPLADMPTYQENLQKDPVWIDFMVMKESLLISRLNDLAGALRSADPNHILYYSNAHDFNPAWRFLHCFDRGRLRWDVIGVGQHDAGSGPQQIPQWASCREYIQTAASYGPYIGATGAYPKGFACGEGQGGRTREGVAQYYPWWLADIVGSGGAFFQSHDWNHIAGRGYDAPTDYDDKALDSLGEFLSSVYGLPFMRQKEAEVLILRNRHAAYGMSAGYDFANTRYLASVLYQLHIPFDILPDSDLGPGAFERGKINLNKYRFIFVPAQNQLLSARAWQMLEDWIADPRFAGKRSLCLGLYQDQDCYFNPSEPADVHPAFERLTGTKGYTRRLPVAGMLTLRYPRFFGRSARGDELRLRFPKNAEIGVFEEVGGNLESVLEMGESGPSVVIRNFINGNSIFSCGFYLGMAYDPIWGREQEQDPYNTLNPLYMAMLETTGVEPTVVGPDNLGIYIADAGTAILLKERFGKETDVTLELQDPGGAVFAGTTTILKPDGVMEVKDFRIPAYGTLVLPKSARLLVSGGQDVSSVCTADKDGLECRMTGKGKVDITLELKPDTIYAAYQDGDLIKMFTTDGRGREKISIDLGTGLRPVELSVKLSDRRQ